MQDIFHHKLRASARAWFVLLTVVHHCLKNKKRRFYASNASIPSMEMTDVLLFENLARNVERASALDYKPTTKENASVCGRNSENQANIFKASLDLVAWANLNTG